jgi:hypothetical protein
LIIVGITGKAGSGKDTVADRLVARHGFKKMSFAGPLKDILRTVDPILGFHPMHPGTLITLTEALAECGGEEGVKKLFPAYRKYAQKIGTEGVRKYDPEFWIKAAASVIMAEPNEARLVFTDCRFPNEARAIQEAGMWGNVLPLPDPTTELWCITRPGESREGEVIAPHASEEHVGNMGEDYSILNGSDLDHLYAMVDDLAMDLIEVEDVKLSGG